MFDDEEDILTACALRFDGHRYVEKTGFDHNAALDRYFATSHWPAKSEEQLALFFMLQRYPMKWGGECESKHGRYWRAFRELFLIVHDLPIPHDYRHDEYDTHWQRRYHPHLAECTGVVRRIHAGSLYDDAAPTEALETTMPSVAEDHVNEVAHRLGHEGVATGGHHCSIVRYAPDIAFQVVFTRKGKAGRLETVWTFDGPKEQAATNKRRGLACKAALDTAVPPKSVHRRDTAVYAYVGFAFDVPPAPDAAFYDRVMDTSATIHNLVWQGRVYSCVEYGWHDDRPFAIATPRDPDLVSAFLSRMRPGMPDELMPAFTDARRGGVCFADDPKRGEA